MSSATTTDTQKWLDAVKATKWLRDVAIPGTYRVFRIYRGRHGIASACAKATSEDEARELVRCARSVSNTTNVLVDRLVDRASGWVDVTM